jgi:hypothetical protein
VLALVAALAGSAEVVAAGPVDDAPGADSTAVADSARVIVVPAPDAESAGVAPPAAPVRRSRPARGILDQPRWVMLRSLAVPGWGQAHNGAWVKAVLVAGTEGLLISRLVDDNRVLRDLEDEATAARLRGDDEAEDRATNAYNARLDEYVARQWLLGGAVAYALVDAYVDAHFRDFDLDFEYDPALPGGAPGGPGGRLSLRWRF